MKNNSIPAIAMLALALISIGPAGAQERPNTGGAPEPSASLSSDVLETIVPILEGTKASSEDAKTAAEDAKAAATAAKSAADNANQSAQQAKNEAGMAKAFIAQVQTDLKDIQSRTQQSAPTADTTQQAVESIKTLATEAKTAAERAEQRSNEAKTAAESSLEAIKSRIIGGGGLRDELQTLFGTVSVDTVSNALLVLSSLAAIAGILAVVVAVFASVVLKGRIGHLGKALDAYRELDCAETKAMAETVDAIRKTIGDADLKTMFQSQVKPLSDAIRSLDGKISGFDRTVKEIPGQFDSVAQNIKGDAESHRRSIFAWLFGRGRTQAPESGFAQQIEERVGQFQNAVLSAMETEKKLQSRKLALDDRERKLDERTRNLDAELGRARAEGAATSDRKAASLEAANKAMAESLSSKATEFGKKVALLESERDAAKASARQAESTAAAAKRQADEASKFREKLTADVARLSNEIATRDKSRDADLAKAREEIRTKLEKANADEIAGLRAEAKTAREERAKAEESVRTLRDAKTAAESALTAAKASLDAEKAARENDRTAAARELSAEKAARGADREKAEKKLSELAAERDKAKSRVFPAEFRDDPDFEPLLARLDAWDAEGVGGATLARASLAIFADRKNLPAKIWLRALGDFSLGLAAAMEAEKIPPTDVVSALGKWKAAIEKHAAGGPSFSLNLPSVGTKVDISWMHAKAGAASVRRVLSWAVYGQSGNAYMAEVE